MTPSGNIRYSKKKFTDGVVDIGLHQIGKLRHDTNRRYLYQGPQKPRGRRRPYDGKVPLDDLSRLKWVREMEGVPIDTTVVHRVGLKRTIRIAYLVKPDGHRLQTARLFSTDTELSAEPMYRYYKARFQIEFLFLDTRSLTGLTDCQARSKEALHFHFNFTCSSRAVK